MKGSSRRPDQVAEVVRQVVADALLTELRDPRIGFVTVTEVRVTNELSVATVRVSVMGDAAEQERALEGLTSAAGFLRSRLGKAVTTRLVPEIRFELDQGLQHAARINQILGEIKREQPD